MIMEFWILSLPPYKNALGIPLEPYGFSRNARARFSAPPFEDAKIRELKNNLEIQINIQ